MSRIRDGRYAPSLALVDGKPVEYAFCPLTQYEAAGGEARPFDEARKLLETTDMLLSDIAVETGFFDQSHLTRIFKKERGMTPGEYRRNHQTNLRAF